MSLIKRVAHTFKEHGYFLLYEILAYSKHSNLRNTYTEHFAKKDLPLR